MVRTLPGATGDEQTDSALLLTQSFTPFGEELEKFGESEANFGYTGQKYDTQTGLLYLRARYYAPGSGRFVSHDTWSGDSNNPMSYNAWLYGYGNPVYNTDCSGMFPCPGVLYANAANFDNCEIYDWIVYFYGGYYQASGIDSSVYMYDGVNEINVAGWVTTEFMERYEPGAEFFYDFGTTGLSLIPGNPYAFGQFVSGIDVKGDELTGEERIGAGFESLIGIVGECKVAFFVLKYLPEQWHHFATNKNSVFTPIMETIANKYGLSLDDAWNIRLMKHLGRHPNDYHDWIYQTMKVIDIELGGSPEMADEFMKLFEERIIQPVLENPSMLRKLFWK